MPDAAMIFDVERFSTADGPGIRTSVFFKGCNLRCPWCHNPEGLSALRQLRFDPAKCIGCGACLRACKADAHAISPEGAHVLLRERCTGCMECVKGCYAGALEAVGREISLDELTQALLEDEPFYRSSGGGITVTGGEALCQAPFVAELFDRMHAHGVHTAVESNLSLPWNLMKPALTRADLVMFDLKCMDERRHSKTVGLSNQPILANIQRLGALHKPAIARTAIIPGFSDAPEEIRSASRFLKDALGDSLLYYELLPYHPLGSGKAERLGMSEAMAPLDPPDKATLLALARAAGEADIPVKINGKTIVGEGKA